MKFIYNENSITHIKYVTITGFFFRRQVIKISEFDDLGIDQDELCEEILIESDEEHQIVVSANYLLIPELGLRIYEGVFLQKYENEDELVPDWSLSLICRDEDGPEKYLYYEQDGIACTLYNYLTSAGLPKLDYECQYIRKEN